MLQKSSLTLSDGTKLDDLIIRESNEVSLRVMSDKELYDIEMERVFAKTWLLLAHDTEIPNSGDFVVRDMAEDNVIIARDREGNVNVSLNVCPHRGMRVCTAEAGNKPIHQCKPWDLVKQGLAMVPEGRGVFTRMTIVENLQMGAYSRNDGANIEDDIERIEDDFGR